MPRAEIIAKLVEADDLREKIADKGLQLCASQVSWS